MSTKSSFKPTKTKIMPKDTILIDMEGKKWKLGPVKQRSELSDMYLAQEEHDTSTKYHYAIRTEPKANERLMLEIAFLNDHCKLEDVEEFRATRKIKSLGIPVIRGTGIHDVKGEKYVFLVVNNFGSDLNLLLKESGGQFPPTTTFKLAWQIVSTLEYFHERGFVIADINGSNIRMGASPETKNQAFLVNFSAATPCGGSSDQQTRKNPAVAQENSKELLSRDAHNNVASMRGDLETLGYNIIVWLGGQLLWRNKIVDPAALLAAKIDFMENPEKSINLCFLKKSIPETVVNYFNYVMALEIDDAPDYGQIKKIFTDGIETAGGSLAGRTKKTGMEGNEVTIDE